MFVALVGPDGAGKTTVARALEERSRSLGTGFWYQHWVPSARNRPVPTVPAAGAVPPKRPRLASVGLVQVVVSILRLGRNLLRFWIGYVIWLRPKGRDRPDTLIVADRWIYNYVGQPYSVAYHGPAWLARVTARAAPRPDLVAVLLAPGSVMAGRKSELTAEDADLEAAVWSDVSGRWWPGVVFNAQDSPDRIALEILDMLTASHGGSAR